MALSDPYDPYGFAWPPPEWQTPQGEQQFDPSASLVGSIFDIPKTTLVPPDPQMPPAPSPYGEAYNDDESRSAPTAVIDDSRGAYVDPTDGRTVFPFGPQSGGTPLTPGHSPIPTPRTDAARIGLLGGPSMAEEVARAPWDETIEMPSDAVGAIEMPDDYVGRGAPTSIEMPDDYVGRSFDVDAISGGVVPGQEQLGAHQTQGVPGSMPDEYLTPAELGERWASLPIEEQEKRRGEIEDAKRNMHATRLLDETTRARREAEDNARDYQRAVQASNRRAATLDAEAVQLASERIDPNHWWASRSTGQSIAGYVAAIVGGLAASANGGRNVGLEAIERAIDRDIDAQKTNLQARQQGLNAQRSALSNQFERDGDMFKAAETVRIASYDSVIQGLEAQVQNYDPRGSTALRTMDNINQLKAKRASTLAKYRDDELKRIEGALKLERDGLALAETQRHNMAGEKNDATRAYADVIRAKADKTKAEAEAGTNALYSADQLRAQGIAVPEGVALPAQGWSVKQAKSVADTAKSVEDWQKAARDNSPEERNRQFAVGELVDESGKPLNFRSTEGAEKVATLKGAADFGVQLLDRLKTSYQQHGWSSDLLKSPEWQEAQADLNQYMLEKKNIDALGVLAGPDLDLIKGTMGKVDPTGIRDPGAGLTRARKNVVEKLNSTVRAQAADGSKPARWEPPEPPPPAPKSPLQGTVQKLLTFNPKRMSNEETAELGGIGKTMAGGGSTVPPSYAAAIDRLVGVFNNPGADQKERDEAAAHLEALKTQAKSDAIRAYAVKAASSAAMESVPVSSE